MTQDVTTPGDADDGFSGSLIGNRLIKGQILRWNDTNGWVDRDGLRPPDILLVLACDQALQKWQGKKPIETITAKPLPDLTQLNETVPKNEWELGLDNKPRPPWVLQVIVYLIDPRSAGLFTYLNSTTGARIAYDVLREKVVTMRALRGARVVPLVKLSHRPMKTAYGMRNRPEFEIVDWRTMGGGGSGKPLANEAPAPKQLPASPAATKPDPAAETIAAMGEVSIPTLAEELQDELPWR